MRRHDKELTEHHAAEEIIRKARVCRLALCDGNTPYIVPMSFGYREGCLYFHSAREGRKIELLRKNPRVCFEMEIDVETVEHEAPCSWTMRYASVIGTGRAHFIEEPNAMWEALETIFRHYSDAPFDVPKEKLEKLAILRVEIESMTAKASQWPPDRDEPTLLDS